MASLTDGASPYGARPVGTLSASGSFTGKVRQIPITSGYSENIFNGDFVKIHTDGTIVATDTADGAKTACITCGIFMGCSYTKTGEGKTFATMWAEDIVATDAMAYVLDDPFVVFQMQATVPMNNADRNLNAGYTYTGGSTSLGKSKSSLTGGSPTTTATLPLRVLDFVSGPHSLAPVGTTASDQYPEVLVKFNHPSSASVCIHQYLNATGV
jgi:hypothetical protein